MPGEAEETQTEQVEQTEQTTDIKPLLDVEVEETPEAKEAREAEETAETERRAALSDEEREAEDTKAEEERRAALTDEERAAEDEAAAKAKAEEGAPEEYADFTAPEGVELDAETLEAFKPLAKELNLTQEAAQKLIDLQTDVAQRWQTQVQEHVVNTRLGWREASQADKEFGGDAFQENLAIAKEGRDLFGDDELKALLDESGIGDHPAVIRWFWKAGKANSEHAFVTSGKPEKSKSFYDHPTSQK